MKPEYTIKNQFPIKVNYDKLQLYNEKGKVAFESTPFVISNGAPRLG